MSIFPGTISPATAAIGTTTIGTGAPERRGLNLLWLTVLGHVQRAPVPLGVLVMRLEALMGELDESPRGISRCLHEMDRGGHIVLANRGRGWWVSLGPNGRATFHALMDDRSPATAPDLEAIGQRLRQGFATMSVAAAPECEA